MFRLLFITALLLAPELHLFGQSDSIDHINAIVAKIDNDSSLAVREFDATEVYGRSTDGGGTIVIHYDQTGIKKIEREIGLSYGRITTIIYLDSNRPIKIIDREENFNWKDDDTGWDYNRLDQVFQADIYIFDWEADMNETIKQGHRVMSEGKCAVFEYEPLLELGRELIKK